MVLGLRSNLRDHEIDQGESTVGKDIALDPGNSSRNDNKESDHETATQRAQVVGYRNARGRCRDGDRPLRPYR
jgi:hypothetical protein